MVLFFGVASFLLAVLGGLYWLWKRRVDEEITEGAAIEWGRLQKSEPEIIDGLDEAGFRAIYARVHFPRFPGYALAALTTFFASLPVTFGLLAGGLWAGEKLGFLPEPVEIADRFLLDDGTVRLVSSAPPEAALYYVEDLAGFYYFFGVLAVWLLIVAVFMYRYHSRRPGYLRDELLRSR